MTAASRRSAMSQAPTRPRWRRAASASTWFPATAATNSMDRSSVTTPRVRWQADNLRGEPHCGGDRPTCPKIDEDLGLQPRRRRSDQEGQGVVLRHLPQSGREQIGGRQLLRRGPLTVPLQPGPLAAPVSTTAAIKSIVGRVAWQVSGKDKVCGLSRQPEQDAPALGHQRDECA